MTTPGNDRQGTRADRPTGSGGIQTHGPAGPAGIQADKPLPPCVRAVVFEERPLPADVERAIRHYGLLTRGVGGVLLYGALAGRAAAAQLAALATALAWEGYREWRLRRRWPCPRCGGALRLAEQSGRGGQELLACARCGIGWATGRRVESGPATGN